MTTQYNGQLEIDHERGVIYFHLFYITGRSPAPKEEVEQIIKEGYEALNHAQELYEELAPQDLEVLMSDELKEIVRKINEPKN